MLSSRDTENIVQIHTLGIVQISGMFKTSFFYIENETEAL